MRTYLKNIFWLLAAMICITSCDQEEVTDVSNLITTDGKIPVRTEITVDGVITRASSEAGYTTGDGLYDEDDQVTVAAFANEGYELVRFYNKNGESSQQNESSYTFRAKIPLTFKAEFARKYTITVSASPAEGGTVSGGGKYGYGKSCTLSAIPNAGYAFDGWYEGSTKISSETNYTFTVSSSRTITGKFKLIKYIVVGDDGYIISSSKMQRVGTNNWNAITYSNGKYVAVGGSGYITVSTNGVDWNTPKQVGSNVWNAIIYANGKFVVVGYKGQQAFATYSTDGIEWAAPVPIPSLYGILRSIAFGNGKFVAVGYHEYGGKEYGYITTSTDGVTWTSAIKIGEDTGTQLKSVTFGNGKFAAIGEGYATTSEDGISWSSLTRISYDKFYSIIYAKDKFVICGSNTVIYTSTDLVTFEERFSKRGTSSLVSLLYEGGRIVALRSNGYYLLSEDGINWSEPAQITDNLGNPVTANLNDICVIP